jgi:hypothetical protein
MQFREAQSEFQGFYFILAVPAGTESPEGSQHLGHVTLPCLDQCNRPCKLVVVDDFIGAKWFECFKSLSISAGLCLPVAVKDSLQWTSPSTPFAWWFATMWAYGAGRNALPLGIGTSFRYVFEESSRAIQRILELMDNSSALIESSLTDSDDKSLSQHRKIKPDGKTVDVIRLVQAGKTNDEIVEKTGKSSINVRKIRSHFNNGKYDIS